MDKDILKNIPHAPGVYRIYDKTQTIIYVGKAKNLRKRVASYLRPKLTDSKTIALMEQAVAIEPIITNTENEALLLENTLIKKLKPHYNILFKDDKSYPYLYISEHKFPRLALHRGPQKEPGFYFGPYPNATAAREVLELIQKIFKIRSCNDSYFKHRTRPCVQYQIKRCSGPCVGYINANEYAETSYLIQQFLKGKSKYILQIVKKRMQEAAAKLNYEQASYYRDQLQNLEKIYQQQYVATSKGDSDALAVVTQFPYFCVQILFIRNGKVTGSKSYFNKLTTAETATNILSEFIIQYYLNFNSQAILPKQILVNIRLADKAWIADALGEQLARKITINDKSRGTNLAWVKLAETNANHSLGVYLAKHQDYSLALNNLAELFTLPKIPQQLECFDISHTMGEATIASCVVFGPSGAIPDNYRRFRIENITKSDDYAALRQALLKRYTSNHYPDLLIIDGGKGQLSSAIAALNAPQLPILAIAKGPTRKPGVEVIHATTLNRPIQLEPDSPILHLLQQIRDEAHRFAITGHRRKRAKQALSSILESIPGVGPRKRQQLLEYFGGLQKLKSATVAEIVQVPGVNQALATTIYKTLQCRKAIAEA